MRGFGEVPEGLAKDRAHAERYQPAALWPVDGGPASLVRKAGQDNQCRGAATPVET
jgi:hypothetical protein